MPPPLPYLAFILGAALYAVAVAAIARKVSRGKAKSYCAVVLLALIVAVPVSHACWPHLKIHSPGSDPWTERSVFDAAVAGGILIMTIILRWPLPSPVPLPPPDPPRAPAPLRLVRAPGDKPRPPAAH